MRNLPCCSDNYVCLQQVLLGMALAQISWLPRESHLVIPHLIGFNTGAKNENRNQNIYAIKNVRSNVSIYIYMPFIYIYIYAIYIYTSRWCVGNYVRIVCQGRDHSIFIRPKRSISLSHDCHWDSTPGRWPPQSSGWWFQTFGLPFGKLT